MADAKKTDAEVKPVAADVGLVEMVKEGVVSFVHETCVAAHEVVGWVRAHV